jgi:tRNA (guanine-N7-)-methyltransferase
MPDTNPLRRIKSFIRRSNHLNERYQRAYDLLHEKYLVKIPYADQQSLIPDPNFRLASESGAGVFQKEQPLIIEIGSGYGDSIVNSAKLEPQYNYLGLEVFLPALTHTMMLARDAATNPVRHSRPDRESQGEFPVRHCEPQAWQSQGESPVRHCEAKPWQSQGELTNLKLIEVDAKIFIEQSIDDNSVTEFRIYFPDPWRKRKHHKRRLVNNGLIELLSRKLVTGGKIRIATDWEDYAESIELIPGVTLVERFEGRCITKFERRALEDGRKIFDFVKLK